MNKVWTTIVIIAIGILVFFFLPIEPDQDISNTENDEQPAMSEDGLVTLPSGLQYRDLVVGDGNEAVTGNLVLAHYRGTLEDGTEFDSSYGREQPFAFLLGQGQVIAGWEEGILGMKAGGKRMLIIPSHLGYGDQGAGDTIPPGATLIFEVDLLASEPIQQGEPESE